MKQKKSFWSKYAKIYDRFMHKDRAAYERMYALIRPAVKDRVVLELATGTGLIAKNIASETKRIEATDSSPEMIAQARVGESCEKLRFSVQDMFALPYADGSFEVVIAANVLHIIPSPEKALAEIRRVLSPDGILIAPTFTHGGMGAAARMRAGLMKRFGFPLNHAWSPESYLTFLRENGWEVKKSEVISASFPLTYAECAKRA